MKYKNQVIIRGVLGNDPDVRYNNKGEKVINLLVGIGQSVRGDSIREEKLDWISVMVIEESAVYYAEKSLRKGCYVELQGRLRLYYSRHAPKYEKPELCVVVDGDSSSGCYVELVSQIEMSN